MSVWFGWRLIKFLALSGLVAGMAGALARDQRRDRLKLAYGAALPSFVALWIAGYALMRETARSFEPWILVAMASSLMSLHLLLQIAHRPRPRAVNAPLMAGSLAVALAEMVLRPTGALHVGPLAVGLLAAVAASGLPAPVETADPAEGDRMARMAVLWSARIEGASLIALLALSVGRRALGLELGAWPALAGWGHGVIVIVWLHVLMMGGRALGWSLPQLISGLVTLLPLGPLLYERWGPLQVSSERASAKLA